MDEPSIGHPENLNSANRDIPIANFATIVEINELLTTPLYDVSDNESDAE